MVATTGAIVGFPLASVTIATGEAVVTPLASVVVMTGMTVGLPLASVVVLRPRPEVDAKPETLMEGSPFASVVAMMRIGAAADVRPGTNEVTNPVTALPDDVSGHI